MIKLALPTWLQSSQMTDSHLSDPKWMGDFRQQHWNAFQRNGLPTKRNERWKYTDFSLLAGKQFSTAKLVNSNSLNYGINLHRLQQGNSILLVFVNGSFVPHLSDINKFSTGIIACNIKEATKKHEILIKKHWPPNINAQHHPFASLNSAIFTEGLFLYLPDDCELQMPVHLLHIATDQDEFIAHPHHLIVVGRNSKLTVVEEYTAIVPHESTTQLSYMMNNVATIVVERGGTLEHIKIQNESQQAIHLAHNLVRLMCDSHATFTNFSFGSQFARDDLVMRLQEPGSSCAANGFYHLRNDKQYIDHHIDINHVAPESQSAMLYKGILEGQSCAVFNGRLCVEKDAQNILAHQANHNLLLSKNAEMYTKPELEIYADNVKCKHGATIGQLNEEALFYLCSRGIDRAAAINILLQSFAEDILQHITHPGVRARIKKIGRLYAN